MKYPVVLVYLVLLQATYAAKYSCGQSEVRNQPYGKVKVQVDCDYLSEYNLISLLDTREMYSMVAPYISTVLGGKRIVAFSRLERNTAFVYSGIHQAV